MDRLRPTPLHRDLHHLHHFGCGVRLYLDGKCLIENWNIHGAMEDVIQVDLIAGKEYPIQIDCFEQKGMTIDIIKLYWESMCQPKEYIPEKCLFAKPAPKS